MPRLVTIPDEIKVVVGFTTSDFWISRGIRYFTQADVSHLFIEYTDPWNSRVVLEATWPMVLEQPAERAHRGRRIVNAYEITVPYENLQRCRGLVGHWYDFGNLPMFAGMLSLKRMGITWSDWKSNPKHFICTDLGLRLLDWEGEEKTQPVEIRDRIAAAIESKELNGRVLDIAA